MFYNLGMCSVVESSNFWRNYSFSKNIKSLSENITTTYLHKTYIINRKTEPKNCIVNNIICFRGVDYVLVHEQE